MLKRTLGMVLRQARAEKKVSLRELAKQTGMHWMTIHYWEIGKARPNREHLKTISNALGIPLIDLLLAE